MKFKLYEKIVTRINDFGSEEDCIPISEVKEFVQILKEEAIDGDCNVDFIMEHTGEDK